MKKLTVMCASATAIFMGVVGNALAVPDPALTDATGDIQTYFTDNLPVIIALFVGIAMLLWVLGLAFRSVGVKKPTKVG